MQLKSLQIQGFKSFPDKTTLVFGRGLTSVVGPNGSGKSNISDAVRWVLGEQSTKNLRGDKMEDVIFLGTRDRKPIGFAAVSLVIDNSDRQLLMDADEVIITRKLFRDGESEYRLNKSAVRLKDINELLMDTGLGRDGYSIIGQGRIEEIVSAKSSQRREIFEEAAGISKYRYRKEEAEKRLENAYENLLRLKDIMTELEDRVGPLKVQSEKATRFLQLAEEKKKIEISLWIDTIEKSKTLLLEQENNLIIARNKQSDVQAILNEFQCRLDEGYEQMQKCSVEIEEKRNSITEMNDEIAKCDSDVAVLNNDIFHSTETRKELEKDIMKYVQSKETTKQKISDNLASIEEKQKHANQLEQEKETLETTLQELSIQLDAISAEITQQKSQRAAFEQSIEVQKLNRVSSATLIEETTQRMKNLDPYRQDREDSITAAMADLKQCKELLADIDTHLTSLENSKNGYSMKLENRRQTMEQLLKEKNGFQEQENKLLQKSRILSDMEKNMEGYYNSVKHVMNEAQRGKLHGIHNPISQLISTATEYTTAIETALGGAMQHIVTENEDAAKKAIQNLKFAKAGRATFLPIDVIQPQSLHADGIEKMNGFVGIASELIDCSVQYRKIIQNLLGRVVIADTIDDAISIARKYNYRFRIVTLDGQLINIGGSLTGGSTVKNTGILSRKDEIDSLKSQAEKLHEQSEALQPEMTKLKEECASLEGTIVSLNAQIKTAQEDKITYVAECKRLQIAYEGAVQAKEDMIREYNEVSKKLESLKISSGSADKLIASITQELEATCQRIAEQKIQLDSISEKRQEISEAINTKRFELLTVSKDIQNLQSTSEQLTDVHSEQKEQVASYTKRVQTIQESIHDFELKIQQTLQRKKDLMEKVSKTERLISDLMQSRTVMEQKLNEIRNSEKDYIAQKERVQAELSRLDEKQQSLQMEYDQIISKLWDEYNLTRSQASEIAIKVEDSTGMKNQLADLKNKIKALGNVNVAAIEEYREINERYTFMKTQMEDVENSRNELTRLIRELTSQMREMFRTSFDEINQNFKQIFRELFLGGEGNLVLTDPENVLESGIEINVQPPGKIIKTLASLSGGEKAFVAIAIYFAILKVRPSPFCILDEIEAALDEVNVTRYARYLKKLSDKTQFIAITHRRGTMEEADVMYGVTMQEKGVSRLLELDISQVEDKLGIKA